MLMLSGFTFLFTKNRVSVSWLAIGIFLALLINAEPTRAQLYGDGSDGDVTISSTVTLTGDRDYDNLTVTAAGVLITNGFEVRVNGTLTNMGTIRSGFASNLGLAGSGGNGGFGIHVPPTSGQSGFSGVAGPPGAGMGGRGGGGGGGGGGAWDATNSESVAGGDGGFGGNGGNGALRLNIMARNFNNLATINANGQPGTSANAGTVGQYDSYTELIFLNRDHAGGGGGGGGGGQGGAGGTITIVRQNLLSLGLVQTLGGPGGPGAGGGSGRNTDETAGSNQNEENGAGGGSGFGMAGNGGSGGRSEMDEVSSLPGAGGSIGSNGANGPFTFLASVVCYVDSDGDNFGNAALPSDHMVSCPAGFTSNNTDCDDNNPNAHPGALEICNGFDDNCDGITDCFGNRGDANNDGTNHNILDLTFIVDFIFRGGPPSMCPPEGDLNSDGTPHNVLDLTFIVDLLFRGGPPSGPC